MQLVYIDTGMAFYLTYRPQTIAQLDLPEVRQALYGVLSAKPLPHALLFSGIRGTGKTSSARILAKAINCTGKRSGKGVKKLEPCNRCDHCQAITQGHSMDVIEMDAASHRGIDDIRELRQKARLAPSNLKYKVYIIDEVHMLTTEAFNALLKILEEPPAQVIFVLCTTEPDKLPVTIRSRCLQINFRRAKQDEIIQALKRVVKGEKLKVDPGVLENLAHTAGGSFRDATKLLEELSWAGKHITMQMVSEKHWDMLDQIKQLIAKLEAKQPDQIMAVVEQIAQAGTDMQQFGRQLLVYLHQQLLNRYQKAESDWQASTADLLHLIKQLDQAQNQIKYAAVPQLPLEVALIEWLTASATSSSQPSAGPGRIRQSRPQSASPQRQASQPRQTRPVSPPPASLPKPESLAQLEQQWSQLMNQVKQKNFAVEALLRATRLLTMEQNQVVLEVFYPFHFEKLQEPANRRVVEQTMQELWGDNWQLKCRLGQKPTTVRRSVITEEEIAQVKPQVKSPAVSQSLPPVTSQQDDDLVKFAAEIFGEQNN